MHVIVIPGLWLDASSWDDVVPALHDAGHHPHALTMPGVGDTAGAPSTTLRDWVDAVVARIDDLPGQLALVGHSGGGNVAWAAADRRPDRIARVVLVDTLPPAPGAEISAFPVVDGVVPFPGWEFFDEPDVADLDDGTRARWAARTHPVPAAVPTDAVELRDARRHGIPVTVLSGSADEPGVREMLTAWPPFLEEFDALDDVTVVELGSGHWPQFSQPDRLGREIVAALM
ncbi:alpha/beta hydrolase [Microbacterium sp. NE2HP2]|uniref:alpha/beta fold hydrolase n=1 Tax=Microbacterium TaxID=33882 RepID=UPI00236533F4|nr:MULTISPECIES: alpha/beta hydrolase [Microbacterium]MDD7943375.1 alpha/beta hydrolase [Microbacterium plantarum]WHE37345.1 alpha/beta hydrolase [Microbacterium sp. BDGP8]WRK18524.1 alpha/beta hydrolase [Microbacterium plantarum]